ncbi:hypothetical protein AY600_04795 [Phormidium willei BDU 130791]|nr:hypothetical protein AY600_04795 [Phormidium willei BDU 130791]
MNDLSKRLAALSPRQRALLKEKLAQQKQTPKAASDAQAEGTLAQTVPLSFAQQRLWFLHRLAPDSPMYNLAAAVRLRGFLDQTALEQSLNEVRRRHQVLRSRVMEVGGQPQQVIHPWQPRSLPRVDLQSLTPSAQAQELEQRSQALARHRFDLAQDEPLAWQLLQLAPDDHQLLIVLHHIVSDGWSKERLIHEVAEIYQAQVSPPVGAKQGSPLPPLPLQYADVARWQRQRDQDPEQLAHLAYWRQQLHQVPPLALPILRPAVDSPEAPGALYSAHLSPDLTIALKQFSQKQGVTLFMTLLAAFKVLLWRYSGQTDLVLGVPTAGRSRADFEPLIGCFINPVVLRSDLSGNPSFRELLQQIRETATQAYSHGDIPFERLVEELQPDRTTTPLFQVMFALQNLPRTQLTLPQLSFEIHELHPGSAKFDLTVALHERDGGLTANLEYRCDRIHPNAIARLWNHYQTLLTDVWAHPDFRLSQLSWLSQSEQQQLLQEWNQTQTSFPESTLVGLVENQVQRTPEAVAVLFEDQQLTYGQLNDQAERLGQQLHQLGIGPEMRVAVALRRSPQLLIALLAILKTGAAYVPLDPNYPQDRLTFILQDSQPALVLTESQVRPQLPQLPESPVLDIESLTPEPGPRQDWSSLRSPEALAYLIYTSGSTGQPKGVAIEQQSVVNFLQSLQAHLRLSEGDRLLAITTLSFDIAVLELFLPLTVGAQVQILPDCVSRDGSQLAQVLNQSQVTVMQATPATWQMLLSAGWSGKDGLTLLSGGEALSRDLAAQLLNKGEALWNLYGPTETTIWSTVERVDNAEETIPIGRPIHNTQVYVLDNNQQPVPIGIPGELYLGGAGLAREYWRRPGLTRERFLDSAWGRLYRTGDLVRYREDGVLEHLGRLDHQVKLRGYRIELGEIESQLRSHPQVNNAVVIAREDEPGQRRLVAYIVGNLSQEDLGPKLRRHLQAQLPDYMVPSLFVELEQLPLTPNGKVDRRALPKPSRQPSQQLVAPRNDLEQQLAELWANLLQSPLPSIHDNFFELGGHSLLATQLIAQIRDRLQVDIPLRLLFDHPTLAEFASQIERQTQQGVSPSTPGPGLIRRVSRDRYRSPQTQH